MNSYELSRNWFDWSFENPEKINPNHTAIYFFAIEHCNRLGWKEKFGFPTQMTMEAIGIKKHQTYMKYFNDLVEWGFIKLIEKSKNQYSSNIISLINAMPKKGKAYSKANINHAAKQVSSIGQSNSSIDKPNNLITIKPNNKSNFSFRESLLKICNNESLVDGWIDVRKKKKASNTEAAFKIFLNQLEKSKMPIEDVLTECINRGWYGFKAEWMEIKSFNQPKKEENKPTTLSYVIPKN